MSSLATINVLDGHDSIGGTKILLTQHDHRVLLDFGTNYRRMNQFYAEFLRPRSSRGVLDFLVHGMLPELRGFYRRDLFPPDEYPHGDNEFDGAGPTAALITHAHLDHCGALAFLDPQVPTYATPTTLALLRSWQETGKSDLTQEVVYWGERTTGEAGGLRTAERGVKQHRNWRLLGDLSTGLSEALSAAPSSRTELVGRPPEDGRGDSVLRELNVRCLPVDHSLMGSAAFLLDVDGARIGYTGDVRFHGERGRETEAFLRELERRSPDVLLVEGTRLEPPDRPSRGNTTTEEEVRRNALAALRPFAGRFAVADFGPRNVERLRLFRDVAQEADRRLVVTARDAHLLGLLALAEPNIPTDFSAGGMRIWAEPNAGRAAPWQQALEARFPDAAIDAREITTAPGRWLICFSYLDVNDLVDLRRATAGGLWLYSSSEAHGEEQEFDFARLKHWIDWARMGTIGFTIDPATERPEFVPGYHASGHASQAELIELVRRANPRAIVPVHSERPRRYAELLGPEGVRVVIPVQGRPMDVAALAAGSFPSR
ncbi:MAG: MBL fold metallo-hydrolase [Thermoplasmata archaeon]|nr:MBL fold metallo-hydrolase [Thermoplasmata archaeon]